MKRLKPLLMILISACILLYLVQKIGMGNLYKNIAGANPAFLLLSLFFIPFNILLRIGRWFYLVRLVMPDGNFKEATKSFIGGTLMAIITPGKAGDLTRIFFLLTRVKKLNSRLYWPLRKYQTSFHIQYFPYSWHSD